MVTTSVVQLSNFRTNLHIRIKNILTSQKIDVYVYFKPYILSYMDGYVVNFFPPFAGYE
jgi:hypothetical protein